MNKKNNRIFVTPTSADERTKTAIRTSAMVILLIAIGAVIFGLAYADWWAFSQKYPHASFWAWVISSK